MNLRQLECFMAVATELHFGKAAEKLFIAQPPLSRTIRELEEELQVKLFVRNSRHVELTRGGEFLKEEARKLLAGAAYIKSQIRETHTGKGAKLKIGYVGAAMHSVLPEILVALKKQLDVSLLLFELKNEEQVNALHLGQIDMGFVRSVPERGDIGSVQVFRETFSLIVPLKHKLAAGKKIHLKELAKEPFIGLTYDCAPRLCDKINDICRHAGFSPNVAHETSQINSIVRLVESGMGYSIVPSSVKKAYALKVKFIELAQYHERAQLFLMHKRSMDALVDKSVRLIHGFIKNRV